MEGVLGDPLRDAESLLSFMKMEDGLLTPNQVIYDSIDIGRVLFLLMSWLAGEGGGGG